MLALLQAFATPQAGQIVHIHPDGEMASIRFVAALDRAPGPLFKPLRADLCHFSRQIHRIYEFMTWPKALNAARHE